jgi:hypothetical protein
MQLGSLNIASLEALYLNECLTISAESRVALGIMPEAPQGGRTSNREEGPMTIYTLLNTVRTPSE